MLVAISTCGIQKEWFFQADQAADIARKSMCGGSTGESGHGGVRCAARSSIDGSMGTRYTMQGSATSLHKQSRRHSRIYLAACSVCTTSSAPPPANMDDAS